MLISYFCCLQSWSDLLHNMNLNESKKTHDLSKGQHIGAGVKGQMWAVVGLTAWSKILEVMQWDNNPKCKNKLKVVVSHKSPIKMQLWASQKFNWAVCGSKMKQKKSYPTFIIMMVASDKLISSHSKLGVSGIVIFKVSWRNWNFNVQIQT